MSASEKLRALEPWLAKGSSREVIALVDALPQIVAVVEALEPFTFPSMDGEAFTAWGTMGKEIQAARAALAALDEALS